MINPPRTIVSAFFQSEKKKKKKEEKIKETGSIPDRRAVRRKQSKASLNFTLRTLVVECFELYSKRGAGSNEITELKGTKDRGLIQNPRNSSLSQEHGIPVRR